MNEQEIWAASERLDLLFSLLPQRIRDRRANSHLRSLTNEFMDYLTRSNTVSDAEANRIARAVLGVYRVTTSLETLYGRPIDANITGHALFREVMRLFDSSKRSFEGAEFTLYTAAHITVCTDKNVTFVPERVNEASPDLCVSDLCYVECKDLAPLSTESLRCGMRERLQEASAQLAAAQARDGTLASGVALDLPLRLFQNAAIESSPAGRCAFAVVAETLSVPGEIAFIILSISGCEATQTEVGFPYRVIVFTRPGLPVAIFTDFLGHLASRVYVWCPDRQREHRIRERAFFLWEKKTGRCWWDSMSNWIEAEEQDAFHPAGWLEFAINHVLG
jgi:hypothetical protein